MSWWAWPLFASCLAALIGLAWYLIGLARRLDRLHKRVEDTSITLVDALARRAAAAVDVAGSGALEPASALVLATSATAVQDRAGIKDTAVIHVDEDAESDLTRTLKATLQSVQPTALLVDGRLPASVPGLAAACQRTELARRFHNEAVIAARAVRRKRLVRFFRLAGTAPMPATIEFDDAVASVLLDPALVPAIAQ